MITRNDSSRSNNEMATRERGRLIRRRPLLRRLIIGGSRAGLIGISLTLASQPLFAQQQQGARQQPTNQQAAGSNQAGGQNQQNTSQYRADESPALGLVIGSCPGNSVCVLDTVWGSPADQAGIQDGDYLLSINGKQLSSPQQMRQLISTMKSGEQVSVKVWRGGQEFDKQLTLASQADERPDSHRAWLGVMLSSESDQLNPTQSEDNQNVVVRRVVGGSPADRSGLRPGDAILQADGNEVDSVEGFIQSIEEKGPGSDVELTISRNNQQREIAVQLGDVDEAPMNFFREAMRPPMDSSMGMSPGIPNINSPFGTNRGFTGQDQQMLDQTLDNLRQRVRELERQVQQLNGGERLGDDGEGNGRPILEAGEDDQDTGNDLGQSGEFRVAPKPVALVAQQRGRGNDDRARDQRRNRDQRPDWNRGRGGWDRDDIWDRRGGRGWTSDSDWRDRYRGGYRDRLYRSPGYGNNYYRYGGRPYYNNYGGYGVNPYYSGRGVRFGNFGLYWY